MNDRLIKKLRNFIDDPIFFLLRQVYRLIIIYPFQLFVSLYFYFIDTFKAGNDEPNSDVCFIITSVVYPEMNKKIEYGSGRSIFNPPEREQQTLTTINSIKTKVLSAKIVLIEGGKKDWMDERTKKLVDQYIFLGNNRLVRFACDSKLKSFGEAIMLIVAFGRINFYKKLNFKISGRYYLNDNFNLSNWHSEGFTVHYVKDNDKYANIDSQYILTRIYSFSYEMINYWKSAVVKGLPYILIGYPIENTLAKFFPHKFVNFVKVVGIAGIAGSVASKVYVED